MSVKRQFTGAQAVSAYCRYAALVCTDPDEDDNWENCWLALSWRDVVEDRWEDLSEEQACRVADNDSELTMGWRKVKAMLGTLAGDLPDARYWWWHLDEGPQVREEAKRFGTAS